MFRRELREPELEPPDQPAEEEVQDLPQAEDQRDDAGDTPRTREIGIQAVSEEVDLYFEIRHHTNRANLYERELLELRTRVEIDHTARSAYRKEW